MNYMNTEDSEMGFVKDAAKFSTLGLAGQLFSKNKKKPGNMMNGQKPMMTLTNRPVERPTSMIGGRY